MSSSLTVGILQADFPGTPLENAEKAVSLIKRGYREADLVVLPEYSMLNPLAVGDPSKVYEYSETLATGRYVSRFVMLAKELETFLLIHVVERTDTAPYSLSTSTLISPQGEVVPVYSKMHLFDAYGFKESVFFRPGRGPGRILNVNGVKIGVAICFDIRFPELFRTYAYKGVEVVIVQAAWVKGPLKEHILDNLATARAHENGLYIVLVDHVGEMFVGRSGVFNPMGYKELDLGASELYAEYTLNMENVKRTRETIPVLKYASERWLIQHLEK